MASHTSDLYFEKYGYFDSEDGIDIAISRSLFQDCDPLDTVKKRYDEHIDYVEILVNWQHFCVIPTRGDGTCGWQSIAATVRVQRMVFNFDIPALCREGVILKKQVCA